MNVSMTPSMAVNLCPILSNEAINAEYRLMTVAAPAIALTAKPGQFFHLKCPTAAGQAPYLRRPMSIYDIDRGNGRLSFLYKVQGTGTRALADLRPGDTLDALGPLGRGFDLPETCRHLLLIGRGVGLATLAPLAEMAQRQGVRVTAVLSARTPSLVMSREVLERRGARVLAVTDHDGSSDVTRLTGMLADLHAATPFDRIATCGSNRLFGMARNLCDRWQIDGDIALEARMGCGTGMCQACVVRCVDDAGQEHYRTVCADGPVFGIREATSW
ncbi:MAG: dihydroorotate dehydrogenase electron transfer subunit [Rhodobacteraceae bacterium]|nr:dihydroorotate dehydrogenase electron transfer subunit [Paracoccaceae bacterium]MAY48088.1 dihydroorotate dehydrogenase electron transfer subunit [Paracoccaceae bacterium]|tara:strand:+ start:280 stop:1098 length:819 start_codon:yes stop_codon:yes gene_type:complete